MSAYLIYNKQQNIGYDHPRNECDINEWWQMDDEETEEIEE